MSEAQQDEEKFITEQSKTDISILPSEYPSHVCTSLLYIRDRQNKTILLLHSWVTYLIKGEWKSLLIFFTFVRS